MMTQVLSPRVDTALPSITFFSDGTRLCQPSEEQYREYRQRETAKLNARLAQSVATPAGAVEFDQAAWLEQHNSMSKSKRRQIERTARLWREGQESGRGFTSPEPDPERMFRRAKHQEQRDEWLLIISNPETGFQAYMDECAHFREHGVWPNGARPKLPNCTGLPVWRVMWLKALRSNEALAKFRAGTKQRQREAGQDTVNLTPLGKHVLALAKGGEA